MAKTTPAPDRRGGACRRWLDVSLTAGGSAGVGQRVQHAPAAAPEAAPACRGRRSRCGRARGERPPAAGRANGARARGQRGGRRAQRSRHASPAPRRPTPGWSPSRPPQPAATAGPTARPVTRGGTAGAARTPQPCRRRAGALGTPARRAPGASNRGGWAGAFRAGRRIAAGGRTGDLSPTAARGGMSRAAAWSARRTARNVAASRRASASRCRGCDIVDDLLAGRASGIVLLRPAAAWQRAAFRKSI
jgi:hypothetical protein